KENDLFRFLGHFRVICPTSHCISQTARFAEIFVELHVKVLQVCYNFSTCYCEGVRSTVSVKLIDHNRKAEGINNVKICVQHKRLRKYLDTTHFVVRKQLPKDFKVKYPFIADKVEKQLRDYRKIISELDDRLEYFTAESLRDYLRDKDEDVDFIKF